MIDVKSGENQAAPALSPNRDAHASRGSLHLAASGAERLNARGGMVRPGNARRVPVKREPRHRETGSDRDRRPATDGCVMSVLSGAQSQRHKATRTTPARRKAG